MKVIKRGRLYYLDISLGKDAQGKEVRRRVSLHTDEYGLALERARDKARELESGVTPGGGLTFADFEPRYMEWARATKPKTARTEAYYLKAMIAYFADRQIHRLDQVTPEHVENFRVWIRQQDRRTHPKEGVSPIYPGKSTVNRYCACLRKFYNLARDFKAYTGENPVSRVKFYKETGRRHIMTAAELSKVLNAARALARGKDASRIQKIMPDLITFSLNTGLRKSEVLNLRWRDVRDDEVNIIGKGDKRGTVPLNAEARAVIDRQARTGHFVFDVPSRLRDDALRPAVDRIRAKSGVPHFGIHICRHYFASELLAAGVDLETVARLMRHSRMMTTLLYTHSTPERMRFAVDRLGTLSRHTPADVKRGHRR